jgi:hypothetical protein
MPWISIPTEFVVAATEILDERVPSTDHASRAELRQTPHGSQPRLESSVIGLDRIISVWLNNVTRGRRMSRSSLIFGGGHDRQAAITGSS